MRLLEFPCGRRVARPEEAAPPREKAAAKDWEGKRRRRASPWRPSLVAISEDGALVVGDGEVKGGGSGGGPRKERVKSTSRVVPRPFKDDYGHYGVPPTVVPAFAPTAFIF